jgi:hypothetical protein
MVLKMELYSVSFETTTHDKRAFTVRTNNPTKIELYFTQRYLIPSESLFSIEEMDNTFNWKCKGDIITL